MVTMLRSLAPSSGRLHSSARGPGAYFSSAGATVRPSFTVRIGFLSFIGPSWSLFSVLSRDDLNGGGACTRTDHRAEILAALVLRLVSAIDKFIDRSVDRLEGDFFREA